MRVDGRRRGSIKSEGVKVSEVRVRDTTYLGYAHASGHAATPKVCWTQVALKARPAYVNQMHEGLNTLDRRNAINKF